MFGFQTGRGPTFNSVTGVRPRKSSRSGQVLIEFAFVSLAFYFLLAGTVEMGRALHGSQALQNAARVCARELSVMPMPATITFDEALGMVATDPDSPEGKAAARVRNEIYDRGRLVIDVTGLSGSAYEDRLALLPIVNRMLVPLMIREEIELDGATRDVLRYPGAIFANPVPANPPVNPATGEMGYIVRIPRITSRGTDGVETIEWAEVVDEIHHSSNEGPFSITSTSPHKGLVAVRMHYPFQAATLSAYDPVDDGTNDVFAADDSGVAVSVAAESDPLDFSSTTIGTYSGPYGLGSQEALTEQVRPFRRLLSAQSIFRREVFQ